MAFQTIEKRGLIIGASLFFVWGITNTWFGVMRYGIEQGMYWWYCNLALFAVAYGIWKRNASWIIAWLSFALFTQPFWILDNIWRVITGKNLFGLIEFMYQPGYPLDEFLVSHYHYFIIPTAIMSLFFIKQKKSYAKRIAIFQSIFIFGMSYFLFPAEQNINCIHESCFSYLERLKGPIYSILFSFVVISVCTIGAHYIEKLHKKLKLTKGHKIIMFFVFCVVVLISIGLIVVDVSYKNTLPKFTCSDGFGDFGVSVLCRFSTESKDKKMWFVYEIRNKLPYPKRCTTKINMNGINQIMHQNLDLEPLKRYKLGFIIPYPIEDVNAKLSVSC